MTRTIFVEVPIPHKKPFTPYGSFVNRPKLQKAVAASKPQFISFLTNPFMPEPARTLLFYTHAMTGGGAERVWALLASGFARRGFRVILAVDFDAAENLGFVDPDVQIAVLGGNHVASTWRLRALLREQRPDISMSAISVSNLKHFIAALLAGRLRRAIQTYHGYAESEPQLLSRLGYALTPLTTRLFARTITVSEGLRRYIVTQWRASPSLTKRIYNPIRMKADGLPRTVADLMARPPLVIASGRLVDYKNFELLIEAFARVRTPDAHLILMGEGPRRREIESIITAHDLQTRVTLTGYVEDPWPYYDRARCFVLTSRSESFGLVVAEALSRGLAVVSTECDGPREILDEGRYGALVRQNDPAALAQAIDAALTEPGEPGPRIARADDYRIDKAVKAYAEIFDDILSDSSLLPGRTLKPS